MQWIGELSAATGGALEPFSSLVLPADGFAPVQAAAGVKRKSSP
jgi:hypothetical protein